MKKLLCVLVILATCFIYVGMSYAGDEETLIWKIKFFQEKKANLEFQYAGVEKEIAVATEQLAALKTSERANAKVKADAEKKGEK